MPGSAILDPDVLLDDLIELAGELREDLNRDFGVRPHSVFLVTRTWETGVIGDGVSTEVEVEIVPQPLVKPYTDSLGYELHACGLDEAGFVKLEEVDLSYTQAELTGKAVVNEEEQDLPDGSEFIYRIREAQGQAQSFRDFKLEGSPFPDREKTIGWKVRLLKVEESY